MTRRKKLASDKISPHSSSGAEGIGRDQPQLLASDLGFGGFLFKLALGSIVTYFQLDKCSLFVEEEGGISPCVICPKSMVTIFCEPEMWIRLQSETRL